MLKKKHALSMAQRKIYPLTDVSQVPMTHKVAQITTVTFWYTNSIWNPIIYFCVNKKTQEDLAGSFFSSWTIDRKLYMDKKQISSLNNGIYFGLEKSLSGEAT